MSAPLWFRIGARALGVLWFIMVAVMVAVGGGALFIFALATMGAAVLALLTALDGKPTPESWWFVDLWWLWIVIWCIGVGAFIELRKKT